MTTWSHMIQVDQPFEDWDNFYTAQSVHLPNCLVYGQTMDEAREKMAEAIRDYYAVLSTGEEQGGFRIVDVDLSDVPQCGKSSGRFVVYLEPEFESEWIHIQCPFLWGCSTQGDSESNALEMIKDVIVMRLEEGNFSGDITSDMYACSLVNVSTSDADSMEV